MPVQLWISVLTLGSFFGLLALGYYLVLEGTGFFNFAIGPYAMFSAMTCSWLALSQGWNIVLALGVSIVASVGLSVVTDLGVVRVVEKRSEGGELQALIAVVAVLFVLEQLAGTLFGRNVLPGAAWVNGSGIRTASVKLSNQDALLVIVTIVIFLTTWLWLTRTEPGRLLRAIGSNPVAARTLGLPVKRIRAISFAVAGLVVGIAGPLFAPHAGVNFQSGLSWALWGFLALVIGGTGSVWAPLVGGLLLAGTQVIVPYYLGSASLDYAVLIMAFVFFVVQPTGIFTRRLRI